MLAQGVKQIRKVSLKALKHISLTNASHNEIFKNEHLPVLINRIKKIYKIY